MTALATLKKLFARSTPAKQARSKFFRPAIDALEDRRLMAVFIVDDDFAADNPARRQYTTIQGAVDAAITPVGNRAGDSIVVRPGLYNESVSIDKRITITGAVAPAIPFIGNRPYANDPSLNPARASIVDPATGAGFTITASNVILQGFTVANFDESEDTQGIVVTGGTANKILRNVIVDNTIGISLATDTATSNVGAARTTYVTGNVLRDNNTLGAAAGNGIYSDAGLRNVSITANRITGHENASILAITTVDTDFNTSVTIASNLIGNQVTGEADSAIILANLTNSTVVGNVMRNIYNNGTGIALVGGVSNVKVLSNNLANGAFTGINVIFRPGDYAVAAPNSNNLIQGNVITNFGDGGIRLREGANNNVVKANVVQKNGFGASEADANDGFGSGISLEDAIDNIVELNVSYYNDTDGFYADLLSSGNIIRNNTGLFNGEHDFHDDSIGAGTAGTANTYTNNRGRNGSPAGLIRFRY
ncbi:hypothetical protein ETAA8_24970 [Anatilimnocola aggregata]|uniref:Right handed beta helix domain-containing protein n=1 Tax=Anatilimnocola aggregata TaxID=2528021 RepID=A0A517YB03_9BACT|nr:right-handed parallel beta-helix repeat-containing protein [Anatilimnocola aggregata]QDU27410.1 hypothetical protein ETAA8_24970 [Anatilimnocola aggregata]